MVLGYAYPKMNSSRWMKKNGRHGGCYPRREGTIRQPAFIGQRNDSNGGKSVSESDYQRDEVKAIQSYVHFHEDKRPDVLAIEKTVYDVRDRVAGTLDRIMVIDDALHVVDLKKTSGIYGHRQNSGSGLRSTPSVHGHPC